MYACGFHAYIQAYNFVNTVHTSYNLNVTHVHTQKPLELHMHDFVIYMYYELPSCISLHACPKIVCMKISILHVYVRAGCDKHNTTCTSILSPRSRQGQAKFRT